MNLLKIFLLIILSLSLLTSCKSKEDKVSKEVKKPIISTIKKPVPPKHKRSRTKEFSVKVHKIGEKDELTCENICFQQGYCQKKMTGKNPALRSHNRCIALCSQKKKSNTQQGIADIYKKCVGKFRGDKCDELKKCFKLELKNMQKILHGKK